MRMHMQTYKHTIQQQTTVPRYGAGVEVTSRTLQGVENIHVHNEKRKETILFSSIFSLIQAWNVNGFMNFHIFLHVGLSAWWSEHVGPVGPHDPNRSRAPDKAVPTLLETSWAWDLSA